MASPGDSPASNIDKWFLPDAAELQGEFNPDITQPVDTDALRGFMRAKPDFVPVREVGDWRPDIDHAAKPAVHDDTDWKAEAEHYKKLYLAERRAHRDSASRWDSAVRAVGMLLIEARARPKKHKKEPKHDEAKPSGG